MKIVADLPRRVREIENTWIPLGDGCRLAARVWLPEDAQADPVPAILEYLPYRKRDGTAERDEMIHPYIAGHGYACLRVDIRGSGESDGVLLDEYLRQEQDDALEVIAWIAAQPWCTGGVGMIGISWGGFNGLQVAARRPAALKAVITLCSTDDRYADDAHYHGRLPAHRKSELGVDHVHQCAAAARSGAGRGALARDVAAAPGGPSHLARALAAPSAPRRLLEARLGLRGLWRDPLPGLRDRRLGGRLLERRARACSPI